MRRSDSIIALAKALVLAKGEMTAPTKNKTAKLGDKYSYTYADLAGVKDSYQAAIGKHGMSVIHSLAPVDGHVVLSTTLLHESGEWIASDYPIQAFAKPQEQGSALTYFKRYNVCALLDIVAEDDDDGAAAQASKGTTKAEKGAPAPSPSPQAVSALTQEEVLTLSVAAKAAGFRTPADLAPFLEKLCRVRKVGELSKSEYVVVLEALNGMAARAVPA